MPSCKHFSKFNWLNARSYCILSSWFLFSFSLTSFKFEFLETLTGVIFGIMHRHIKSSFHSATVLCSQVISKQKRKKRAGFTWTLFTFTTRMKVFYLIKRFITNWFEKWGYLVWPAWLLVIKVCMCLRISSTWSQEFIVHAFQLFLNRFTMTWWI